MLDAIGALGALPTQRRRGARSRRRRPRASPPACASSCSRSRPRTTQPGFTSPVAYPKGDDEFPRRLAGLAAMLGAGLPVRVVALSAPGMYDTHDDQPQELADGLKLTADSLLAFQRDLEARGLADRVARPRLVGVRPPREGERLERDRPRRRRRGLPDRLARERDDDRRVPRVSRSSTSTGICARPRTSAALQRLLEQWLGADAEAIIPGARKFATAESDQRDRGSARAAHTRGARARPRPGRRRRVRLHALPRDDQGRAGDRAARQLRRGRARPSPPARSAGRGRTGSERSLPARVGELEARFLPGRFPLWCSLADHRVRGMTRDAARQEDLTPGRTTTTSCQGFRCGGGQYSRGSCLTLEGSRRCR